MYKEVLKDLEDRLNKSIESLVEDFKQIRAGRANPALLDKITIECYGTQTPLQQVASISAPEARMLVIQPWDSNNISAIEKAILQSDLGITPSNDGKLIRLPFPILTEDRRKELIKVAKKYAENSKVSVRNIRRDAMDAVKKLEKDSSISEDERKTAETEIQEIVDKFNKKIDKEFEAKEKDLLEV